MSSSKKISVSSSSDLQWFKSGCLNFASSEMKCGFSTKSVKVISNISRVDSSFGECLVENVDLSSNSVVDRSGEVNSKTNSVAVVGDESVDLLNPRRKRGPKRGPQGLNELLKTAAGFRHEPFFGANRGIDVSSPHYKRWLRGVNYRQKRWDDIKIKNQTGHDASTPDSNDIELKTNVEESSDKLPKDPEVCTPNIPRDFEGDLVIISSDGEDV